MQCKVNSDVYMQYSVISSLTQESYTQGQAVELYISTLETHTTSLTTWRNVANVDLVPHSRVNKRPTNWVTARGRRNQPSPTLRNLYACWTYGCVSKSFRTGCLQRKLQMVQFFASRCSCVAILWVSLVNFAAITLCVVSLQVFIVVSIYFIIYSVRKLFDTHLYLPTLQVKTLVR
jgi:hypothetical protein